MEPASAELEIDRLTELLTERTRLVCFTQCSNITGSINDVGTIARTVHDAGALVCVDAVAYAPHRALDVRSLDVDFYVFSAYKLYGPHLGVLYGKREHLLRAHGQNHFFIGEQDIPLKLIPGGVNYELTAGLHGIIDYFESLYRHHLGSSDAPLHQRLAELFEPIALHEQVLANRFLNFLAAKPKVRLIGRASAEKTHRTPIFSFVVSDRDSEQFPLSLIDHRIAIRAGDFYAKRCINALGLDKQNGVVRASMVHYNTVQEVDRLIERLDFLI